MKYHTKAFDPTGPDVSGHIDAWVNGFRDPAKPGAENSVEIVGYVVAGNHIVITVRVFNI